MISYEYNSDVALRSESEVSSWIQMCAELEKHEVGELQFIFFDDEGLHALNVEYLDHDNLTDVISFDYTIGKILQGEICISVERVKENSVIYNTSFENELLRVMIHGVLHFCGYKDKSSSEQEIMRSKEDFYLGLFAK